MYTTLHNATPEKIRFWADAVKNGSVDAFKHLLSGDDEGQEALSGSADLGRINYTVWSDVFVCPECADEIIFWKEAVNKEEGKVMDEFPCPGCSSLLTKRRMERAWITRFDDAIGETIRQAKQVPVLINYTVGKKRHEKEPDEFDRALLKRIDSLQIPYWYPTDKIIEGKEIGRLKALDLTHIHQLTPIRSIIILSKYLSKIQNNRLKLIITATLLNLSWMYRWRLNGKGGTTSGTYYICSTPQENNAINQINSKIIDLTNGTIRGENAVSIQCCTYNTIINESINYIFLDPPFGSNLMYSELNFLWESWLKVCTNNKQEAIENKTQNKGREEYRQLMTECFREAFRILKPGRWMTVEFSNTSAGVWNSIQTALTDAGFIIANVSFLDKKQGSFKAVTTTTAVKEDLIISAYKPNGGFQERFEVHAETEEGVWDFVKTHLKYLPVTKMQGKELANIPERDPRILFDQMVAYHVQRGYLVPISSQDFQKGLAQRFPERDGMYFLPQQVSEYDKKMLAGASVAQTTLYVTDEASAIQWLRLHLKERPKTFQEIHPEFIQETQRGWSKNEVGLELALLLEQNFLQYDGNGEVPKQIVSYLRANWKDFKGLPDDHPSLRKKARDRWYVPDPNRASDLEKLRERALLKEFEGYKKDAKKLKVFRIEAVRTGFKKAWQEKDYQTIIGISKRIPVNVLEEDPKLLMWYDQAVTRSGE
jgi:DNA methylase.